VEIDFRIRVVRDPYPGLGRLREQAPVSWTRATAGGWRPATPPWRRCCATGGWAVLARPRAGRDLRAVQPVAPQPDDGERAPAHTRLRSLSPRRSARARRAAAPAVAAEAAALLTAAGPEFDLLADVAEPLAVTVIAELLGVPVADRHRLRPWSAAIVRMYEVTRTPRPRPPR